MSGIFFVGQCFKNNYFDFFVRGKTGYTFLFEVCLCLAKSLSLPQACILKKSCSHLTCEHQWLWISLVSMATQTLYPHAFQQFIENINWAFPLGLSGVWGCLTQGRSACVLTLGSWLSFVSASWAQFSDGCKESCDFADHSFFVIANGRVIFFQVFHNLKGNLKSNASFFKIELKFHL